MADTEAKVDSYVEAVVQSFHEGQDEVREALKMIDDLAPHTEDARPLSVLALRRYVHYDTKKTLMAQWVWSDARAREYMRSDEYKAVKAEIEKVDRHFRKENVGLSLSPSPLRNLKRQVSLWNKNNKVHKAAIAFMPKVIEELESDQYPDTPDQQGVALFRAFLKKARVSPEPTSAAPGTSDHGQMHAVDFVVCKGDKTVASTSTSAIKKEWLDTGLEDKLHDAVVKSGSKFTGPLQAPHEPWHYTIGKGASHKSEPRPSGAKATPKASPRGDWTSPGGTRYA